MLKGLLLAAGILGLAYLLVDVNDAAQGMLGTLLGIWPRSLVGLIQIATSPLLHMGMEHFKANAEIFIVTAPIICLTEPDETYKRVTIAAWVGGGLMIWFLSPDNSASFGLSDIVYGYLGFLVARVLVKRDLVSLVIAVAAGVVYGGLLVNVLNAAGGVSWQGHLGGLICGVVAALVLPTAHTRKAGAVHQAQPT